MREDVNKLIDKARQVWAKPAHLVTDADLVIANAPGNLLRAKFPDSEAFIQQLDALFPGIPPIAKFKAKEEQP